MRRSCPICNGYALPRGKLCTSLDFELQHPLPQLPNLQDVLLLNSSVQRHNLNIHLHYSHLAGFRTLPQALPPVSHLPFPHLGISISFKFSTWRWIGVIFDVPYPFFDWMEFCCHRRELLCFLARFEHTSALVHARVQLFGIISNRYIVHDGDFLIEAQIEFRKVSRFLNMSTMLLRDRFVYTAANLEACFKQGLVWLVV